MAQSSGVKLSEMARIVHGLARVGADSVPEVARALSAELERQIAAGEDPYAERWKLTLDGRQPLQNAAKAVTVYASRNSTIVFQLAAPESLHDLGIARGRIRRRILPSKKRLPDRWDAIIKTIVNARFAKAVSA